MKREVIESLQQLKPSNNLADRIQKYGTHKELDDFFFINDMAMQS